MRQFEMIKLSIWTDKKLAESNKTVNEWLARGWTVLSATPSSDGTTALVAFYRADQAGYR
jgi:hypothetical protein